MTEKEAEIIKSVIHKDVLENFSYELFSFKLIKGALDHQAGSSITIIWDDTFGKPITMSIGTKTSTLESERYLVTLETEYIIQQICAVSCKVQYYGVHAGIKNEHVFFYFQNATSQFPPLAFHQLMEAIPGKIDLLKNFIKCEEIAYMKLPTFKFNDHSGGQAFTLSEQNYFVDLNDNACFFAVRPSPSRV
ncbi:unnamed protein product [Albugo candida]|uniref:Uncharacterized protein n=1 Tax=Albugo candida TaxID=65357 RepID=A0A024FV06_9STRA|nr:unnamed protein product [Albugo candida]|eukprot:CCI10762.1 unnamed protein product [Albugo candida]